MICLKDFQSLQAAVDAAAEYETITVPPGEWRCGSASLKSNLTLYLEKGARLIAPESLDGHVPVELLLRKKRLLTHCFLGLFEVENVSIAGEGEIEFNGHHFWPDFDGSPRKSEWLERGEDGFFKSKLYSQMEYRPIGIWMENCRNIQLRGVTLRNSAAYTVWPFGCERLEIDGITIENNRQGPNTDGLDIDSCRDVRISNCRISAGDDCIALKSDLDLCGRFQPCERIQILNNTLSSFCCGVRLGYEGDNPIRDVVASGNIIHDSNVGFDFLSVIPVGHTVGIVRGTPIENVVITSTVMRNVRLPLKIWSGAVAPEDIPYYAGYVRHVQFSHMEIEAVDSCFLGGTDVSDISLDHVNIRVVRNPNTYRGASPVTVPTLWGRGYMPEPLTVHKVRNLKLNEVQISEEYSAHGIMYFRKITYRSQADGADGWYMYHHEGDGRACVVVLHGHGSDGMQLLTRPDLAPWVQVLKERRLNVLAPDLRGNAWMCPAAAEDLADLIRNGKKQYGWNRVLLIAGSMGGTGALIFGVLHPELVDGIGALGAATDLKRYVEWCGKQSLPVTGAIRQAIASHYVESDYPLHSVCGGVGKLTMPVYLAHGDADPVIPVLEARALRDLLSDKEDFSYTEIPGGGHDAPLPLFSEALDFLLGKDGTGA